MLPIQFPVNNRYFDKWSSDMAYILGFTMADGCLLKRPGKRKQTLLYNIKDYSILEFIRNKISPTRNITKTIYKANEKYNLKERHGFRLGIPIDDDAVKTLNLYGIINRKTGNKKLICEDKFFPDYLRGFFDGDGSICINCNGAPVFSIVSANISFLEEINNKINNILYLQKKHKNKQCYKAQTGKLSNIVYLYKLLYNGGFCLERKKKIFNKAVANE
jgi:hypothetical protein